MARLYLDSNIVMRLVEQPGSGPQAVAGRLAALGGDGALHVASDLVRMECLVKPLRDHDVSLVAMYETYFGSTDVDVVGLTRAVCDRAATIRAEHGHKTPDPLHLAAAIEAGCDAFVTSDRHLATFPDIAVSLVGTDLV